MIRFRCGLILAFLLSACGAGTPRVMVEELPDPLSYGLTLGELPEVGVDWQQTYNQLQIEAGYKWGYLAFQAYQPGNVGAELGAAFAVNNDVYFYESDVSRQSLPKPPETFGNITSITWKPATQLHQVGDKSAVWKTALGDLLTPVMWLEFYQGHAYVRISVLGFPEQIAPSILYGMADIVSARLPHTTDELKSAGATQAALSPTTLPTGRPTSSPTP
jgi:hypothetical protein